MLNRPFRVSMGTLTVTNSKARAKMQDINRRRRRPGTSFMSSLKSSLWMLQASSQARQASLQSTLHPSKASLTTQPKRSQAWSLYRTWSAVRSHTKKMNRQSSDESWSRHTCSILRASVVSPLQRASNIRYSSHRTNNPSGNAARQR